LNLIENVLMEIGLEKGYACLTKREKKIIELYYLAGYRDEEIAHFYSISQQAVNKSRKNGIKKLILVFR